MRPALPHNQWPERRLIRLAHRNVYDVAILFSQDQDLSELCSDRAVRINPIDALRDA